LTAIVEVVRGHAELVHVGIINCGASPASSVVRHLANKRVHKTLKATTAAAAAAEAAGMRRVGRLADRSSVIAYGRRSGICCVLLPQ